MDGFPNMGTTGIEEPTGPATWATSSAWVPADIPPRPWLARGYFMRGAITAVVGAGGVSKSMLMLAYAVAMVLGKEYGGMKPAGRYRVCIFNVEDDDDEQRRRLSATLTSMGSDPIALTDRLMRAGPIKVGTLLAREGGDLYRTDAMLEMVANLRAFRADVLILDPLAELHTEDENANVQLREVVAEFRALAKELHMAVVLVHHTRKGIVAPGDMEAARGASSVVSAARVGLTVVGMTEDDAKTLGLPIGSQRHYFRVDGGKSNYAGLTECEWFERHPYDLGQGDDAAVPIPWMPPVDVVTPDIRRAVEAAIERGSPAGAWSPKIENRPRSIKHAFVEAGITTAPGQKELLATLLREGFEVVRFRDDGRKLAQGIRSAAGKPSNVDWQDADGDDVG